MQPRDLPKRRNQLLKHLTDPAAPLRAKTGTDNQLGLDQLAAHVRAAELYWVAPNMAALSMSAGSQLASADFGPMHRPSGCGLMVFADGIGGIPKPPIELPVDAVSWGPCPGGVLFWVFMHRQRIVEALRVTGGELVVEGVPPLVPFIGMPIPAGVRTFAELDTVIPTPILQALAAAWAMMQQPTLVDSTLTRPVKSVRATTQRLGMPDPEVSIIDLRRQYAPDDREEIGEEGGRRYRHRWVVSGHWRDQAHGPERSLRRKTWIAAYVKGPDGAPLLATERVNVWRR